MIDRVSGAAIQPPGRVVTGEIRFPAWSGMGQSQAVVVGVGQSHEGVAAARVDLAVRGVSGERSRFWRDEK